MPWDYRPCWAMMKVLAHSQNIRSRLLCPGHWYLWNNEQSKSFLIFRLLPHEKMMIHYLAAWILTFLHTLPAWSSWSRNTPVPNASFSSSWQIFLFSTCHHLVSSVLGCLPVWLETPRTKLVCAMTVYTSSAKDSRSLLPPEQAKKENMEEWLSLCGKVID